MKKTPVALAFVSLVALVAFLLCRPTVTAAIAKPFRSSIAAPSDASLQEQVVAAERAGLDALKKGDVARFGDLTADEAVFVDDHGPARTRVKSSTRICDSAPALLMMLPIDELAGSDGR